MTPVQIREAVETIFVDQFRRKQIIDLALQVRREALEEVANLMEGDVLNSPDEFTPKEKIRVFDLLERISKSIRALIGDEK